MLMQFCLVAVAHPANWRPVAAVGVLASHGSLDSHEICFPGVVLALQTPNWAGVCL